MKTPLPHIVAVGVIKLFGEYDVFYHDKSTGKVLLEKEGMYYRVYCSCRLPCDAMFCLWYADDDKEIKLGLCVPGEKGLVTRMQRKDYAGGRFVLREKGTKKATHIYKVCGLEKPYVILQNLSRLRMRRNDGGMGVIIEDPVQD